MNRPGLQEHGASKCVLRSQGVPPTAAENRLHRPIHCLHSHEKIARARYRILYTRVGRIKGKPQTTIMYSTKKTSTLTRLCSVVFPMVVHTGLAVRAVGLGIVRGYAGTPTLPGASGGGWSRGCAHLGVPFGGPGRGWVLSGGCFSSVGAWVLCLGAWFGAPS